VRILATNSPLLKIVDVVPAVFQRFQIIQPRVWIHLMMTRRKKVRFVYGRNLPKNPQPQWRAKNQNLTTSKSLIALLVGVISDAGSPNLNKRHPITKVHMNLLLVMLQLLLLP
jgi:hypothetical protein